MQSKLCFYTKSIQTKNTAEFNASGLMYWMEKDVQTNEFPEF